MVKNGAGGEEPRIDTVGAGSRCYGLPAVRTLSEEYRDTPEPEDSDRVPPPEPPGLLLRIVARLGKARGRAGAGDL
ncbi:MAG: hypothetical protein A2V85_08595 [Chloroflexi bacterium RBG_16_72_14]|nr:MAG: hypothetical protein A2V85_08595 [Chloroflexi bacterium RBG_16_72_14]